MFAAAAAAPVAVVAALAVVAVLVAATAKATTAAPAAVAPAAVVAMAVAVAVAAVAAVAKCRLHRGGGVVEVMAVAVVLASNVLFEQGHRTQHDSLLSHSETLSFQESPAKTCTVFSGNPTASGHS